MCGVFGLFLNRPLDESDIALGRRGTALLRHRGPDGDGEWFDAEAGVYLGHRRLAIIDPSDASKQPMTRGGLVVSCNGELYNFRELRTILAQLGSRFTTTGDIEVFLEAWRIWGAGALDRFDGMYAGALWDGDAAHLVTDPFGEKPLFWAETKAGVYVSSEIAPLAEVLSLRACLAPEEWCAYLCLGNLPAPATAFENVQRMPPASHLVVRHGRAGPVRRYWTVPLGEPGRGRIRPVPDSGLDELAAALSASLERRLIADVPLSLFLSSGVDSSLVAALTARDLKREIGCVSVSFPRGAVADESADAGRIAAYLGLPHEIVRSDENPTLSGPAALIDLLGQPSENLTGFPVHQLSRAISGRYKVAVTGMGGDEITFGYGKHAEMYRTRRRYAIGNMLHAPLDLPWRIAGRLSAHVERFRTLYVVEQWERYVASKNRPAIDWLRKLKGYETWARTEFADAGAPAHASVPRYELTRLLSNEHLYMYDIASMRASLELRTPFLSRQVAEAVACFDPRALVAFGQKSLLRRLLGRYLPARLYEHPKLGFSFPTDLFIAGCGPKAPQIPTLSESDVAAVWCKRNNGHGWTRLAVRLIAAAEFFARHEMATT